jgi:hypothetical protein
MLDVQLNLPVLIVTIPLIGGILTILTGRGWKPWAWATLLTGTVFYLALRLMVAVWASKTGMISYELGNWPRQWGIEYRVDALNSFILCIVAGVGFLTTIYAKLSVAKEIPADRHNFFYAVWVLAICGLLGITITGDAFNVYVLLEISSLTVYALIAMGKDRHRGALTASLRYLILGSVGASFILLGIGYLMMITGTLNMQDMHDRLMTRPRHPAVAHRPGRVRLPGRRPRPQDGDVPAAHVAAAGLHLRALGRVRPAVRDRHQGRRLHGPSASCSRSSARPSRSRSCRRPGSWPCAPAPASSSPASPPCARPTSSACSPTRRSARSATSSSASASPTKTASPARSPTSSTTRS